MFDFPALDVAIGLIFLYTVLALVCTTINETISTAFGMRARYLQLGLLNLLSAAARETPAGMQTVKRFYDHPLAQTLIRPKRGPAREGVKPDPDPTELGKWWKKPPYPSYIPSRTFVATLLDMARDTTEWRDQAEGEEGRRALERMNAATEQLEGALGSIPNAALSRALLAIYHSVEGDAQKFQHAAERWFDDAMERVSGWYKRRVQLFLFFIAMAVVVPLNADSLATARVLWRDDATRAAVVKQAEAAAEQEAADIDVENAVRQLDVPLGWEWSFGDRATQAPNDVVAWIAKVLGLAITIAALMLGAPFWFDLLSKISRVRSTGAPPPATDARRSGEGEQSRAGSGAAAT